MLNNKSILITGGTGSFGKAFTKTILKKYKDIKKIVIFSRDEFKQFEMKKELKKFNAEKKLRFFIGDVRDLNRMKIALNNIDYVIHAAALKQVDTAEYNPIEYIKTNIYGAQNLIEATIANDTKKIIALSTDKACSPINLYGATKLCSDKLFIAANNFIGEKKFSIVRYGNVESSRGSVIPFFKEQKKNNLITITDNRMTRFNISLNESVDLVLWALKNSIGGEIVIPKIKSYRIIDLANTICPDCKYKIIGKRPGEKLHEEMISAEDSSIKIDLGKVYILISIGNEKNYSKLIKKFNGKILKSDFKYSSGENELLNKKELKKLVEI